jgi:hypothetical protein
MVTTSRPPCPNLRHSLEHRADRRLLLLGQQVAIPAAHRLGLVPHPVVNDTLIDTFNRALLLAEECRNT